METYTEFGDSYLIQTFVNKINTKLRNNCRVISPPFPPPPRISNFQKEHFTFYETSEQMVLHPPFSPAPNISGLRTPLLMITYKSICIYIVYDVYIYIYVYIYNFSYIILN